MLILFALCVKSSAQDDGFSSITVYVLPKHMEFRQQISVERIKTLNLTRKILISTDSKSFKCLSTYTRFVGPKVPTIQVIDVRLLIELVSISGELVSVAISETELLEVNGGGIHEVQDLKKLVKTLKRHIPRNFEW